LNSSSRFQTWVHYLTVKDLYIKIVTWMDTSRSKHPCW
jgi:hypothetical protein